MWLPRLACYEWAFHVVVKASPLIVSETGSSSPEVPTIVSGEPEMLYSRLPCCDSSYPLLNTFTDPKSARHGSPGRSRTIGSQFGCHRQTHCARCHLESACRSTSYPPRSAARWPAWMPRTWTRGPACVDLGRTLTTHPVQTLTQRWSAGTSDARSEASKVASVVLLDTARLTS